MPDPGAIEIRKALDKADAIVAVDNVTANDIKAAAHETQSTGGGSDATPNG